MQQSLLWRERITCAECQRDLLLCLPTSPPTADPSLSTAYLRTSEFVCFLTSIVKHSKEMCAESNLCSNKYLHKTYASSVIKPELKMAFLTL